jgi:uncharacterized membrane protein
MKDRSLSVSKYLLVAFSIIGLFAMTYLALSFGASIIPQNSCSIASTVIDCGKVVTSQYSELFLGIGNYYLGIVFFAVLLVLSSIMVISPDKRRLNDSFTYVVLVFAAFGAILSVYLIYLELFVLDAICLLCTLGHIAIFSILIISLLLIYERRKDL